VRRLLRLRAFLEDYLRAKYRIPNEFEIEEVARILTCILSSSTGRTSLSRMPSGGPLPSTPDFGNNKVTR